ncbi:MAG TPA: tetratricopeptide repeat protein, partial [Flavisolibacter sp.]
MKKLFIGSGLLLMFSFAGSQSTEQANQYLYYERYQSAENNFHTLLKTQPENAEAWYGLTRTYVLQGKTPDSVRTAPASISGEPHFQTAMGYLYLAQNKKDSAAMYFNQALKRTRQKNAGILAAVAQAHIETGAGDANYAIELLNRAIKRDKRNAQLHVLLGDAYSKLNNGSQAYMSYKEAIEK